MYAYSSYYVTKNPVTNQIVSTNFNIIGIAKDFPAAEKIFEDRKFNIKKIKQFNELQPIPSKIDGYADFWVGSIIYYNNNMLIEEFWVFSYVRNISD